MPFEPGGLADKLGNRYEGRWLVTQLLRLLNERLESVTIEAIGDDEQGVDIWVTENSGVRQAHQCKARNGSKEFWTLGDLNARGVLEKLKYQLDRDPTYQFFFSSSVGFETFHDICDFARRSDSNPVLFFEEKIKKGSSQINTCFENFCKFMSLDPQEEVDRTHAFNYLKRIHITVFSKVDP